MKRGAAIVLALLVLSACGSPTAQTSEALEEASTEVYVGLESIKPDAADPSPSAPRAGLVVDADTLQFVGGNDQARVWVAREKPEIATAPDGADDWICVHAEIGPQNLQASVPCGPSEDFLRSAITVYPSATHEWVEIYVVPDGFGEVTVPGLERVAPNLFVGDSRKTAPPGHTIAGETGSFRLVNDVPPSTA